VPTYVAIGDSTTTGFSVPTCETNAAESPFGCVGTPPATPYPDRIAGAPDSPFDLVHRVGIWGYTIREAVAAAVAGHNAPVCSRGPREGSSCATEADCQGAPCGPPPWQPQLLAATRATGLVTVSLGANDMQFSDVKFWLRKCLDSATCALAAQERAESLRPDIHAMMTRLEVARQNGATIVIVLYYNPYNDRRDGGIVGIKPRSCHKLHAVSQTIVDALNAVLRAEAEAFQFRIVDLGPAFAAHGAGASDSYVFGSDCDIAGLITANVGINFGWPPVDPKDVANEIKKRYDPHPNDKGTAAQANEILEVLQ
jgi:lysophospholipase L1-like esterase